jgi:eukaryotic-like serine/threonine-protein kinase
MRQTFNVGGTLHLYPGLFLGRYELVLRVAAGGMGEVWAARLKREHGFQRLVTIKVIRAELSPDPDFEQMFLDEALVTARIRHPNVVPVMDLGERDGTLFQVLEWVSGEPLSSVLCATRGRPAPVLVAARIAYQICAGLDAAHELRDDLGNPLDPVRCDVSPDNVLVTSEGLVRLVDFSRGGAPSPQKIRGKAPYMAPEHILGRSCDRRTDLFAVGVLLYELLSGVHPFLADDDQITMTLIASARPAVPLSSRVGARRRGLSRRLRVAPFPEEIPASLDRLVSCALAKSPFARIATASDLMHALEEAVPGAALRGSDTLVARWTSDVLAGAFHVRAQKLRAALESLDRRASEPFGTLRRAHAERALR